MPSSIERPARARLTSVGGLLRWNPLPSGAFAVIVLFVLGVYVASPVVTRTDSSYVLYGAFSLVRSGDLDIDEFGQDVDFKNATIQSRLGHTYSFFPYGTEVLVAPMLYVIDVASRHVLGLDLDDVLRKHPPEPLERFCASVFTALAVGVVFLVGYEMTLRFLPSAIVALVMAFGTPAWSTASRALWSHGPAMMLLAIALLFFVKARREPRWAAFAGVPLALAFVVRPATGISLVGFGAVLLQRRLRRQAPLFVAGVACVALIFLVYNRATFGDWLPPYFAHRFDEAARPDAFLGHLFSPGRGLFVYSPVLILSIFGIVVRLRARPLPALDLALVAVLVGHWLLISRFAQWWGGYSFGPRLFTETMPYMSYFLVPIADRLLPPWSVRGRVLAAASFLLAGASCAVHFRGATDIAPFAWNEAPSVDEHPGRLWDWHDPPFLRRSR